MLARIGTNAHRLVLLPALLVIAAFIFFVASPSTVSAVTTTTFTVGCASITISFTTTDAGAYEIHSHAYDPDYNDLLGDDVATHYVPISGAGSYTITLAYSISLPQGTLIDFDEIHIHGDDGDTLVSGVYACSDSAPQGPGFTDDRINGLFGDDEAVIFVESDDAGNPALHIYCINSSALGYLGLVVTEADLVGIPALPAENTLAKESTECRISFYVLTDGSYQINIGDDEEGKTYVINGTGFVLDNREYYVVELGG